MKTVRFSKVVQASGKPETHLILTDPARDKDLQAAIKGERVMTVFQPAVGNATDRGEIGFSSGSSRQFLVFPKSLKKFKGRSVVGLKYDLIHSPVVSRSELARRVPSPKKKDHVKKPAKAVKAAKEAKRGTGTKSGQEAVSSRTRPNILPFASDSHHRPGEEPGEIGSLKSQVRRAMKALEQGKQVAAFNLLKRILDS